MLALTSCQLCTCRFYDPSAGHITVGDHEIRDVTMASLRTKFGVVPQVRPFALAFLWFPFLAVYLTCRCCDSICVHVARTADVLMTS